eukprot:4566936-Pyramimonas_sp.AAC.1
MHGAAPLRAAPGQAARDGEDWGFKMLSQFREWSTDHPLVVRAGCSGTLGCATDPSIALSASNPI